MEMKFDAKELGLLAFNANENFRNFLYKFYLELEDVAKMGKTEYRVEFKTDQEKEQFYPIIFEMLKINNFEIEDDDFTGHSYIEFTWINGIAQVASKA